MEYKFERFTSARKRFRPQISIRTNGAIGLSHGALRKAKMTDGDWLVVLYFDREKQALGLKPTQNPFDEGATKVSIRRTGKIAEEASLSGSVSAQSFFNYYSIPFSEAKSLPAEWDEQHGMLVAILPIPGKNEPAAAGSAPTAAGSKSTDDQGSGGDV